MIKAINNLKSFDDFLFALSYLKVKNWSSSKKAGNNKYSKVYVKDAIEDYGAFGILIRKEKLYYSSSNEIKDFCPVNIKELKIKELLK